MPVVESKKPKLEIRVDKTIQNPGKYEFNPEDTFTIKVPLKKRKEGLWVVTDDKPDVVEEVVFRMWNYDEMIDMKKNATKFDPIRRVNMIDFDLLNQLKLQKLLVSWTFGKDNPRLNIYHVNGAMVDESWKAVKRMQAGILRYILDVMNEYLEA